MREATNINETSVVRLAVPKGSLQSATAEFLAKAGLELEGYGKGSRNYRPRISASSRISNEIPDISEKVKVKVLRPQEIPILVSRGYYDLGISGLDWYRESRCERNVSDAVDLGFGRVDIVLAVPETWSDVNDAATLFSKYGAPTNTKPLRIWTEYLNLSEDFILNFENTEPSIISPYVGLKRERHSAIEIFHSFGATESKPPEDGEAIIDNTQTGGTLRENGLKILHKVLPASTAHLLANNRPLKRDRLKKEIIDAIIEACARAAPRVRADRRPFTTHTDW